MCPCENGETQQVTYSVLGCSFKYEDRRRIFRLYHFALILQNNLQYQLGRSVSYGFDRRTTNQPVFFAKSHVQLEIRGIFPLTVKFHSFLIREIDLVPTCPQHGIKNGIFPVNQSCYTYISDTHRNRGDETCDHRGKVQYGLQEKLHVYRERRHIYAFFVLQPSLAPPGGRRYNITSLQVK